METEKTHKTDRTDGTREGDEPAAVGELYDAIAVILRMVDVIEGRQRLGKAEEAAK